MLHILPNWSKPVQIEINKVNANKIVCDVVGNDVVIIIPSRVNKTFNAVTLLKVIYIV